MFILIYVKILIVNLLYKITESEIVMGKCLLSATWIVRTLFNKHRFRVLLSANSFIIIIKIQRLQVSNTSDSMIMTDRKFNRSCIIRLRSSFLINLSFEKERSPVLYSYSLSPSLTETFNLLQFQRLETLIPDCHSLSWHRLLT